MTGFDWDEFIGTDWGVDASTRNPVDAFIRYRTHLLEMEAKKNWPAATVQYLLDQAEEVADDVETANQFWAIIGQNEVAWIRESGMSQPGALPKLQSHIEFINSVGGATEELERVQAEYGPANLVSQVGKDTWQDIVEKGDDLINPKKSPWPWIVGGVVLWALVKR